ncbi:MAG: EamA family transporter [Elusimicrobia bacterium]|nr:EamA family transporter [Elusimicrobiota bacterium]
MTLAYVGIAVLCWGAGAILDKLTLKYLNATTAFYARTILMTIMFIPLVIWKLAHVKEAVLYAGKISIVYAALSAIAAMTGVFFYFKAMRLGEASKIVPLSSTYPLVAFILAIIFLGEGFTLTKLAGTVLVCAGVFFLSR